MTEVLEDLKWLCDETYAELQEARREHDRAAKGNADANQQYQAQEQKAPSLLEAAIDAHLKAMDEYHGALAERRR